MLTEKNNSINIIIILTNESHRFLIIEQLKIIKISVKIQIILELCSLNTAPALTLAANASPDSTLMVFPSDQLLMNNQKQTLEIIEVQTGKKLSEKDIIRYQDIYGRLKRR